MTNCNLAVETETGLLALGCLGSRLRGRPERETVCLGLTLLLLSWPAQPFLLYHPRPHPQPRPWLHSPPTQLQALSGCYTHNSVRPTFTNLQRSHLIIHYIIDSCRCFHSTFDKQKRSWKMQARNCRFQGSGGEPVANLWHTCHSRHSEPFLLAPGHSATR